LREDVEQVDGSVAAKSKTAGDDLAVIRQALGVQAAAGCAFGTEQVDPAILAMFPLESGRTISG
jgi:hypothetical protein